MSMTQEISKFVPEVVTGSVLLHKMKSDMMAPAVRPGDVIVIDTTDTEIGGGGIFAIEEDGKLFVWQIEHLHGEVRGRIRCTPRNSNYGRFDLELGTQTRIIGRVKGKFTANLLNN